MSWAATSQAFASSALDWSPDGRALAAAGPLGAAGTLECLECPHAKCHPVNVLVGVFPEDGVVCNLPGPTCPLSLTAFAPLAGLVSLIQLPHPLPALLYSAHFPLAPHVREMTQDKVLAEAGVADNPPQCQHLHVVGRGWGRCLQDM